jgi:zinc transporter 1/2/3
MTLFIFKLFVTLAIFTFCIVIGRLSLKFAYKYHKRFEIGNAIAKGIFIGVAAFRLFPSTLNTFRELNSFDPLLRTISVVIFSFAIFTIMEKKLFRYQSFSIILYTIITAMVLGISNDYSTIIVLLFAMIAHKGFETFTFVMNLHSSIQKNSLMVMLLLFSLVTPLGISLGMFSQHILPAQLEQIFTGYFYGFATGTLLYIGVATKYHRDVYLVPDGYHQYSRLLATVAGISLIAITGLWA